MKVAITGASGFIGRALSAALRDRNDEVIPVVRRAPATGEIGWDITAGTIDTAGLERADAVVHLAGEGIAEKRWTEAQKARILDSRVDGTTLIASAMAELPSGPRTLVSGSAMGYYGDRGDEVLTEQSERGSDYLSDVVVAWEAAAAPAAQAGVRTAFIRTGLVLSPEGGSLGKQLLLYKLGLGGPMLPATQWWSWISMADQVQAILWILDNPIEGPFNLTAPNPVTQREFANVLGDVLRRPTVLPVPKFGPQLLLGKELADALLYTSARIQPAALLDSGFTFSHPDLAGALRNELDK